MNREVENMKKKFKFPVSQQANLLGLEWKKLGVFAHSNAQRFEEKKHRSVFFGSNHFKGYHWTYPTLDFGATLGRFDVYYIHEAQQIDGSIFEIYLQESEFQTQLEEVLTLRLGEAEIALVEFLGMHEDQHRFYARDLNSGREILYSPNDYLDAWVSPLRPQKDTCYIQVYRVPLHSVNLNMTEAVLLTAPTYFTGNELRSRALTCLRLNPGGLTAHKLEQKVWAHANWMDFCVDMPIPSEGYLQALVRWEEYVGVELENCPSFPCFLHELEFNPYARCKIVADLGKAVIAIPEFEWVLETLWNEQPRLGLWGKTPRQLERFLCTQTMLDEVLEGLKNRGKAKILPAHVLMARSLELTLK